MISIVTVMELFDWSTYTVTTLGTYLFLGSYVTNFIHNLRYSRKAEQLIIDHPIYGQSFLKAFHTTLKCCDYIGRWCMLRVAFHTFKREENLYEGMVDNEVIEVDLSL